MTPDGFRLPTIDYEPPDGPSLYDEWESGSVCSLPPPLSVRSESYRRFIATTIQALADHRASLLSIGSGNGFVEAQLKSQGWNVLATDCKNSALRSCANKGLRTRRFCLLEDHAFAQFDLIYCDGVFGHLWQPGVNCLAAWKAMAQLGHAGSLAVISNDLADDDIAPSLAVRGSPEASFYRPIAGSLAAEASSTGRWSLETSNVYEYERWGLPRRREVLVTRLLVDDRIEPKDLL